MVSRRHLVWSPSPRFIVAVLMMCIIPSAYMYACASRRSPRNDRGGADGSDTLSASVAGISAVAATCSAVASSKKRKSARRVLGPPTAAAQPFTEDVHVRLSPILGAGAGLFASRPLPAGYKLLRHEGMCVTAEDMAAPDFVRGYTMLRGGLLIDQADTDGMLVLADGQQISVIGFTSADWEALPARGIAWQGNANLARFINEVPKPRVAGAACIAYGGGWWHTTRSVAVDEELLVWTYGGDFWPAGPLPAPAPSRLLRSGPCSCDGTEHLVDMLRPSYLAARKSSVRRLQFLCAQDSWDLPALARAVYGCIDPNLALATTGMFNQALCPASAVALCQVLERLQPIIIYWVGCGHATEVMLLVLLLSQSTRPISVFAVDHEPVSISNAHVLLCRVYAAYHVDTWEAASQLDLTHPISFGSASVLIQFCDAWDHPLPDGCDLIYSGAEQESDSGQPLAFCLQALAGGQACLAMYTTMWAHAPHRADCVADTISVQLQCKGGNKTIAIRDLTGFTMFTQPLDRAVRLLTCSEQWAPIPPDSPLLRQIACARVAAYIESEGLWYPAFIAPGAATTVTLKFDRADLSDVVISVTDVTPLRLLLPTSDYDLPSRACSCHLKALSDLDSSSIRSGILADRTRLSQLASPAGYWGITYSSRHWRHPWMAQVGGRHAGGKHCADYFSTAVGAAEWYADQLTARDLLSTTDAGLPTEHRGVLLYMSPFSNTGYTNVFSVSSSRFKVQVQHGRHGGGSLYLGTFPTAVEAAYVYARYMAGTSAELPPKQLCPVDVDSLPSVGTSPSTGAPLQLLMSRRTKIGYAGVRECSGRHGDGTRGGTKTRARPYSATAPGKHFLGYFSTVLDAAVAIAEHVAHNSQP